MLEETHSFRDVNPGSADAVIISRIEDIHITAQNTLTKLGGPGTMSDDVPTEMHTALAVPWQR
jgi:hypothetical protein